MKIHTLVGISIGLAAASLASAHAPADPMSQGGADAALTFCREVNPAGAAAYKSLEESLHGKGLDDWKRSDRKAAYFKAYTEVRGALDAARKDWALKACIDLAATRGGGDDRD